MLTDFREEMEPWVFGIIVAVLAVFGVLKLALPGPTRSAVQTVHTFLLDTFGGLFLVMMLVFVVFLLLLIVGPWGSIRLGGPDASPGYTYPAYFAMFFSAGLAAGIVWSAPSGAISHFGSPPPFVSGQAESAAVVPGAVQATLLNSGIHAWSSYIVVGVPIAYYAYNKGASLRFSTILMPFIGRERLDSPVAKFVDILAVFATIGGLATSVGLVGRQFLSGVEYNWGVQMGAIDTVIVVAGIAIIFTVSVISGVNRGIRRIATVNLGLVTVLGVLLLLLGPLVFVARTGAASVSGYVVDFLPMTFGPLMLGEGSSQWYNFWTLFYWIWWWSWAPFVGLFLAAISKGRTIRTVALTGVGATLLTFVWYIILGATTLQRQVSGIVDVLGVVSEYGSAVTPIPVVASLPFGDLLVLLFMALIITAIVTSADTSTLTVAILATKRGVPPSTATRAFWGGLQGAVAVGVMLAGGPGALQSAAIVTGGPIGILMLVGVVGLLWQLVTADIEGGWTLGPADEVDESD